MNIPSNLKYTKDHEWVMIEGDIATIGITDFAQGELGDIVYVEVETLDESLDVEEWKTKHGCCTDMLMWCLLGNMPAAS